MNVQPVLPTWLQWGWALAGLGVAVGGLCWILLIFWPYLRWSKVMTMRLYDLSKDTAKTLQQFREQIEPVIRTADKVVGDVERIIREDVKPTLDKARDTLNNTDAKDLLKKLDVLADAVKEVAARFKPPTETIDVPPLRSLERVRMKGGDGEAQANREGAAAGGEGDEPAAGNRLRLSGCRTGDRATKACQGVRG